MNAVIQLKNVDVVFGSFVAVSQASLAVREGEIFVLMGLSGSGKSSLLRVMNGLNRARSGQVNLCVDRQSSIEIGSLPAEALRRLRATAISMVFQRFALMPWRTVAQNVGLGLEILGQSKEHRAQRIAEAIEVVGLSHCQDQFPAQLSGGMQQRVGLARALAVDTPILLMDEPFSALDPLIRRELQDELLRLQSRFNKTIVFVSHDIDEALRIGDRLAIMQRGKIIQIGTPDEIVSSPANDYVAQFVSGAKRLCASCQIPIGVAKEANAKGHSIFTRVSG